MGQQGLSAVCTPAYISSTDVQLPNQAGCAVGVRHLTAAAMQSGSRRLFERLLGAVLRRVRNEMCVTVVHRLPGLRSAERERVPSESFET